MATITEKIIAEQRMSLPEYRAEIRDAIRKANGLLGFAADKIRHLTNPDFSLEEGEDSFADCVREIEHLADLCTEIDIPYHR